MLKCKTIKWFKMVFTATTVLALCACSGNGGTTNSAVNLFGGSECSQEVVDAEPWQGIIQVGDVIVKPNSGMTLQDFKDAGFSPNGGMEEDWDYDQLVSTDQVQLKKTGR